MLAAPLNVLILRSLSGGSKQQTDLRRETGSPAQTTLRAQLKKLDEFGVLVKRQQNRFPGVLEYELTDAGHELLEVAVELERWLGRSPEGPLTLGSLAAKAAIKSFSEGWSTRMLRALAAKPLTLTELDGVIGSINYPSLERRLGAMRLAGQLEARAAHGRGKPYGVNDWVRQAVAPLIAAARWERRRRPDDTVPLTGVDTEAAFMLAMPLLRLPGEVACSCRMVVDISNGKRHSLAGVLVEARKGRITSCTTRLEGYPNAWASGPAAGWLAAVIDADTDGLELGGDRGLARALLDELHGVLYDPVT